MRELDGGGGANPKRVGRFSDLLRIEQMSHSSSEEELANRCTSSSSSTPRDDSPRYCSGDRTPTNLHDSASPYSMSPFNYPSSPYIKSPWTFTSPASNPYNGDSSTGLLGSLVREEGHVYSLATNGDLLYTGSDSKNIRVWKGRKEFCGFKSNSGLVKAIIITDGRIFTGHQDGKIRVWRVSASDPTVHKRVGSLPTTRDFLKSSINPSHYVKVRRHRNVVWLRHFDAVSCLSLDEENGLLYSGSWDKTFKVWRISDSKCLESVEAHDDAINSIAVGFDGLVFSGSADGTVKAWRREVTGRGGIKHVLVHTLLSQEWAVTAVAVDKEASVIYSGSSDGLVNCWEWRPGRRPVHRVALRGHHQAVLCLAAAAGLVLSGSADKNICVWKRNGGGGGEHSRVAVLSGHAGPVKCLAVEENQESAGDNWVVYSGSLDRSMKVWRVSAESRVEPDNMTLRSPLHVPLPPAIKQAHRASATVGGDRGRQMYSPHAGGPGRLATMKAMCYHVEVN